MPAAETWYHGSRFLRGTDLPATAWCLSPYLTNQEGKAGCYMRPYRNVLWLCTSGTRSVQPAVAIVCVGMSQTYGSTKNIGVGTTYITTWELYLEAKDRADEDKHDENQAHVTEGCNLLFVGEVIRLRKSEEHSELQVCAGSRYKTGNTCSVAKI